MSDELEHYGILRKSGRYPWGSGGDEYSRSMTFNSMVNELKKKGMPEKEIVKALGIDPEIDYPVSALRDTKSIAKETIVQHQTDRARKLKAKGWSVEAIAENLNTTVSTVRNRLKESLESTKETLRNIANTIRGEVDEHDIVDIGKGTEHQLGISPERMRAAVGILKDEGYNVWNIPVKNVGTRNATTTRVLVKPGVTKGDAMRMKDRIHTMGKWTEDEGKTFYGIHDPLSVSSKRVEVRFKEDGGAKEDGFIYIRPGVSDLSMGKNTYAQVRIMVDGTHYIKGVAVLKHDMPPGGPDIIFNTNKSRSVGKMGALKEKEKDPNNPFGSMVKKQIVSTDPKTGEEKVTSALNILREEGDWEDWRNSLPSQMLSKQPHSLIRSQLAVTRDEVRNRVAEIDRINNPVVKKKKLEEFAEQIDADAVDLRAASMPRQKTQVIVPMPKMNKNEIYAPQFETGDKVVLIRYPHGGPFEIPEVTVNNNNRTAKKLLGNAPDAIGIHPDVAERLSGADFDGDTVTVISNPQGKIKGVTSLGRNANVYDEGLKNFEPKTQYGGFVKSGVDKNGKDVGNFPLMKNTGLEMGLITNLITDMQVQGAQPEHIVRAVKHSMVVIDAEKHQLNYKKSEEDNNIAQLRKLYQPGKVRGGATTLLSKATASERVPEMKARTWKEGGPPIDPDTGARVLVPTGKMRNVYDPKTQTYTTEKVPKLEERKRLSLTPNAYDLVSDPDNPIESMYASHANEMKALANSTRLKASRIPNPLQNKQAKEVYKDEVAKLLADLKAAESQKPLERRANVYAGMVVKAARQDDPLLRTDRDRLAKVERQAKTAAMQRLGLKKPVIDISDRQWDAIQSGAVSASRLRAILDYADPDRVTDLSMPRTNTVMTSAISARAKAMLAAGATTADIAATLGVSASTLRAAIARGDFR